MKISKHFSRFLTWGILNYEFYFFSHQQACDIFVRTCLLYRPCKYIFVIPGGQDMFSVRVEYWNLNEIRIITFVLCTPRVSNITWMSWPGLQETLWTVWRSSRVILETSRERKEERKLAQQLGLQSTAVLGMSFTLKVWRSETKPSSSRQPHWICRVPTRKLWLHHLSSLNFLSNM